MSKIHIGSDGVTRVLETDDGRPRTTELRFGDVVPVVDARELTLVLDGADWRHDIPGWRFTRAGADGQGRGFHAPAFDDTGWLGVSHLHPLYDVRYDGRAWFRHAFVVPESEHGRELSLVLGGLDDEDWLGYRVFLNGELVDAWRPEGMWREPRRITLPPDLFLARDSNVLAVETDGLDRRRPWMRAGDEEHFFFQGWLLDQFVCSGEPYRVVDDWRVVDVSGSELELVAGDVRATVRYEAGDGPLMRKRVELHAGGAPLELLDVVLEDLTFSFPLDKGGQGWPVRGGGLFAGLEHPAGLNQGGGRRLRVSQLPGVRVEAGASWASEAAVVGFGDFHDYVAGLRPRPRRRAIVYSALGWYDFTNPADPLFELDAELVEENLGHLDEAAEAGVRFDTYMFDDWWEPTDPSIFRRTTFPEGGAAAALSVRRHGLDAGLWVAPASLGWGWGKAPGAEAALAGGVDPAYERPADPDTGKWSWDDVFSQAFVAAPRFCLAAEPLRGYLGRALPTHARELELACLKIDGVMPHCTATDHGHRPGRHSVEAGVRVLVEAVAAAERERPGLVVIWYWGARSPWWLRFGDLLFDKGLKLEAASPSSAPAFTLRHAIGLNTDQGVRHGELIPLALQDSLGVWLGNVAWANRIGKEGWRDALVLDVARGSAIVQLWGDLTLLDDDDRRFLASVLDFVRATDDGYDTTVAVGGEPWAGEPYGYRRRHGESSIVTVYNPAFEQRRIAVPVDGAYAVHEVYPQPGPAGAADGLLELELGPFEVRCVELVPGPMARTQERRRSRPTRPLDLSTLPLVHLPKVERGDWVVVAARLSRDGTWWYHPEPHELVRLDARVRGAEAYVETLPHVASQNGPGYPWVVFRMRAGRSWSEEELRLTVRADLPDGAELTLEGWVFQPLPPGGFLARAVGREEVPA
jgi:hypothetical protein